MMGTVGRAVSVERQGNITVMRVDRPPVNAFDQPTLEELTTALGQVAGDPPPALLITGREGYFSAGLDLKVLPTLDEDGQRAMVRGVNDMVVTTYSLTFPVVAAVTGHAIAGGFIFALCADLRIGSAQ